MEQQQVHILGLRAQGYKSIQAVTLQPDIFAGKLVKVVGEIGNGKSSLLELLQIALSGSDAIAKKDALKTGFLSEVQILDGEHKLFMGVRVRDIERGESKGQPKFETFLFEKDKDGKPYTPVIDGRKATASDYMEMLHTDITFNMPVLFTNNQTEHRKLLEKLFESELQKLGVEEVVKRIDEAKKRQDNTRAICEANGAFKSTFEEEGWTTETLATLQNVDIESVRQAITDKEIEKDRILRDSENGKQLAEQKAQSERDILLRGIQDKVQAVTEQIRELNEKKQMEYGKLKQVCDVWQMKFSDLQTLWSPVDGHINSFPVEDSAKTAIKAIVSGQKSKQILALGTEPEVPTQPNTIEILNGVPQAAPMDVDKEYLPFIDSRTTLLSEYRDLKAAPYIIATPADVDVSSIDAKILELKTRRDSADKNNQLVARFGYWNTWIEAKGMYEKEIDVLRKLYGKVNTGVNGLIISPELTDTGRIQIWLKYNGAYDAEFFGNTVAENRYLFEYSAFQRSIIGLLLQASRLDMKPKVLRMAFVDDISVTKKSIEMIERVCGEFDLKLWTSYAKDDYDLENIPDGEIVVENGSIFFNK